MGPDLNESTCKFLCGPPLWRSRCRLCWDRSLDSASRGPPVVAPRGKTCSFLEGSNRWPSNVHLCREIFFSKYLYVYQCNFLFKLQKSIPSGLVPQNCCGILLSVSAAIQVYPSHDGGGPERGQPAFGLALARCRLRWQVGWSSSILSMSCLCHS